MQKNRLIDDDYFWKNVSGYTAVLNTILLLVLYFSNINKTLKFFFAVVGVISLLSFLIAEFMLFRIKRKKSN